MTNCWFRFSDVFGTGFCSPDLLLLTKSGLLVLECKLTYTPEARAQLLGLYLPVLRHLTGVAVAGVVICRGLGQGPVDITPSANLASALPLAFAGLLPTVLVPAGPLAHRRRVLALPH